MSTRNCKTKLHAVLVAAVVVAAASCVAPAAATVPRQGFTATGSMSLGTEAKVDMRPNAGGSNVAKLENLGNEAPIAFVAPGGTEFKPSGKTALSVGPGSNVNNPVVQVGSPDSPEAVFQMVGRDAAGIKVDTVSGGLALPGSSLLMSAGDKDLKVSNEGDAARRRAASPVMFEPYLVPGTYSYCVVHFESQPCAAEGGQKVLYMPEVEADFGGPGPVAGSCAALTGTTVAQQGNAFQVHENERLDGRFEIHNKSPHMVTVRATLHGRVRRHTSATATPAEVNRLRFFVRRQDELNVEALDFASTPPVSLPTYLGDKSFNVQRIIEIPPGGFVVPAMQKDTNTTAKLELDAYLRLEQLI